MTNMANGVRATETALTSNGSAMEENSKYLDSINGKISQLTASFEKLSKNTISSGFVKFLIDFARGIVETTDAVGLLNIGLLILAARLGGTTILGMNNFAKFLYKNVTLPLLGSSAASQKLTASLSVMLPVAGAMLIYYWYNKLNVTFEEQKEKVAELKSEYEELESNLSSISSEQKDISLRIDEINKKRDKGLTQGEIDELESLRTRNTELEKQLEYYSAIANAKQLALEKESIELANKKQKSDFNWQDSIFGLFNFDFDAPFLNESIWDVIFGQTPEQQINKEMMRLATYNDKLKDLEKRYSEGKIGIEEYRKEYERLTGKQAETIGKLNELITTLKGINANIKSTTGEGAEIKKNNEALIAMAEQMIVLFGGSSDALSVFNNNVNETVSSSQTLIEALESLSSAAYTLSNAYQEMRDDGKLSAKTVLDLIKNSEDWANQIYVENGLLKLNKEAIKEKFEAEKEAIIKGWKDQKIALEEKLKLLEAELDIELFIIDLKKAGKNGEKVDEERANQFREYISIKEQIAEIINTISNGEKILNTLSLDSFTNESKDKTDTWLNAFESFYSELKHKRALDLISDQEYYNQLSAAVSKYFKGNKKYVDEYRQYTEELYALQKSISQKRISDLEFEILKLQQIEGSEQQQVAVYRKIQDELHRQAEAYRALGLSDNHEYIMDLQTQWIGYEGKIEDINDQMAENAKKKAEEIAEATKKAMEDALSATLRLFEEQKGNLESALAAVVDVIDEQISALEDQKKAIQEANEERENAAKLVELENDLIEAQNNLLRANTQRNVRVFKKGEGWIWTTDKKAIKEAEESLADAQKAIDDYNVDQQIAEIDRQIDALEGYKNMWTEVADTYDREQNRIMAAQVLGANWEENVLNGRLETVRAFAEEYNRIMDSITSTEVSQAQLTGSGDAGTAKDAVVSQMKANSAAWAEASTDEEREALAEANRILGESLGWTRRNGVWYDENGIRAYARGTYSSVGKKHIVNEEGLEGIVLPNDGGVVTSLPSGSGVIPSDKTKFLTDFAGNPTQMVASIINNLRGKFNQMPVLSNAAAGAGIGTQIKISNLNITSSAGNFAALIKDIELYSKTHR